MSPHGESIEVSIRRFQDTIEKIGSEFKNPDDDWMGMIVLEADDSYNLVPALWENDMEKEIFTDHLLPMLIDRLDPHTVCQILSAWMVEGESWDGIRPREHPKRREVVIITAITAHSLQTWSAPIIRFPDKPPKLGPWKMWPSDGVVTGSFFDPIREALLRKENP